ncbi:2-acylglycerol O-acyltransferase [Purpureocillium takamizusanense]|uniref:PinX1-related protein 1 n=1 Tax=Purpureocillium takamizusanense TaxID=2060973 RepID=A0A9Q8QJG9_9HYPO|nr:2-acylglycerol O-acyltransferase [Purpureocillium takamizusanense]UNI20983.1 2-acylglycerol O-acyltransferase [Purpureocillium takamizusanense]
MGLLAESKSRGKINKDPNNTKWTRDTTTFGQKMLRAHGWQPGEFLGAKDAAHSTLHTAANASYIRVSVKDDVKGLGWNKAKEDEVTGLDVFSDLLSRLNGKSEESLEGERQARLVMKMNQYVEQKYGPMRFVQGGFLIGDSMKELMENDTAAEETPNSTKKEKKSKKRKASDVEDADEDNESETKKEKRRRKEEKRAKKAAAESTTDNGDDSARADEKKKKKSKKADIPNETDEAKIDKRKSNSKDKKSSTEESEADEPKKSRKSKKDKREKKEKKKRKKAETDESSEGSADDSAVPTGVSTPSGSGTGTSTPRGTRNFVRSRFIAAKRQAMLDTKALNQIFMVKT